MKFSTQTEPFLDTIRKMNELLDHNNELTALRCLEVKISGGKMSLDATAIGASLRATLPVKGTGMMEGYLEGTKLETVLEYFSSTDCNLEMSDNTITLSSGRSRFKFQSAVPLGLEFKLPDALELKYFCPSEFAKVLRKALCCTTQRDANQMSDRVRIEPSSIFSTDGQIMTYNSVSVISAPTMFHMSRNHATKLVKIMQDMNDGFYGFFDNDLYFELNNLIIRIQGVVTPKVHGYNTIRSYPVICSFDMSRLALRKELQLLSCLDDKSCRASLTITEKGFSFSAKQPTGEVESFVDMTIDLHGQEVIHFNARSFLTAVGSFDSEVIRLSLLQGSLSGRRMIKLQEKSYECYVVGTSI